MDQSHIAGRSVKWYYHSANSLAVFLKPKHATTMQPARALRGIYPSDDWLHKPMYFMTWTTTQK